MISTQINTETIKNFYSLKLIAINLLLLLYSFLLSPCSTNKVYANDDDLIVVLVVIDGLRLDKYLDYKDYAHRKLENDDNYDTAIGNLTKNRRVFEYLEQRGAISIWPSYTFAANASIVTGTYPKRHGITGNQWFDRETQTKRLYDAAPIWLQQTLGSFGHNIYFCADEAFKTLIVRYGSEPFELDMDKYIDLDHKKIALGLASIDLQVPTIYDFMRKANTRRWLISYHMYGLCERDIDDNYNISKTFATDPEHYLRCPCSDYLQYYVLYYKEWPDIYFLDDILVDVDVASTDLGKIDSKMMTHTIETLHQYRTGDLPVTNFPRLITLYFCNPDHFCHVKGMEFMEGVDSQKFYMANVVDPLLYQFKQLLQEIDINGQSAYEKTVFILTADHGHTTVVPDDHHAIGFASKSKGSVSRGNLELDAIIKRTSDPKYDKVYNFPTDRDINVFIGLNGGMAHVYLRHRQDDNWKPWTEFPTKLEVAHVIEEIYIANKTGDILDDPEDADDRYDAILVRDYWCPPEEGKNKYKWLKDFDIYYVDLENAMNLVSIDEQDEPWIYYTDPIHRIESVNHPTHSGDIILIANTSAGNYFDIRTEEATHGSLLPSDSMVPFVICGKPVADGVIVPTNSPSSPYIVDIAPTILKILQIDTGNYEFDGESRVRFSTE